MSSEDFEVQRNSSDFWFACVDIDVVRDSSLSLTVRGIYAIICSYASITNRSCWPTLETLAKDAGVSKATVQRALKELIDKGVIVRQDRFDKKRQVSSKIFIVGFHASCYNETDGYSPMTMGVLTHEQGRYSPMTSRTIPKNDIYYSKEGESLPKITESESMNAVETETEPQEKPIPDNPKTEKTVVKTEVQNSQEQFSLKDVPGIMQPTAELLLLKTRRKYLAWEEVLALRELSASQMPARVQKEIDTACERFQRQGKPLSSLRFEYIASALRNQPTRGRKSNKAKNKSQPGLHNPPEIKTCSEAEAEAEMAKIEEMQKKFDEEVQGR